MDFDDLAEATDLLTIICEQTEPQYRCCFYPLIACIESLARAASREASWYLDSRALAAKRRDLSDFFSVVSSTGDRVEPYLAEARERVRENGLVGRCERLARVLSPRPASAIGSVARSREWPTSRRIVIPRTTRGPRP